MLRAHIEGLGTFEWPEQHEEYAPPPELDEYVPPSPSRVVETPVVNAPPTQQNGYAVLFSGQFPSFPKKTTAETK